MWFSFWRSRNRFTLDELRYLTEQLQKIQVVNEVNKDLVIEALRSIAELITYGDQHDSSFFEFFMEKQVMGEFVRIVKISRTLAVSLQLLQTLSIMIQNLKNEHAIYYMFRSEHLNYLITYSFDFQNEELLSYYISFLRAISGKLNKNTISLLLKTQNDQVVAFPLYVEAIRFAFHEESMIRTAVRNVTLNVYHVGDDGVSRYVTSGPHAGYFSELVIFLRKQCVDLDKLVSKTAKNLGSDSTSTILGAVDEIEDNLYYMSDVISAGIPDVGVLITDSIVLLLIFPLLLPSLRTEDSSDICSRVVSSLYLLCCILRIVKIKDLANTIAAALFFPPDAFLKGPEVKVNGHMSDHGFCSLSQDRNDKNFGKLDSEYSKVNTPHLSTSNFSVREALVFYLTKGDDTQVLGSLSVLATLLQTKELDESMLDALGILPQRKQHKKLLLQALAGEASGEEQLFSSESSLHRDSMGNELDFYLQKIKDQYGVLYSFPEVGSSPCAHRFQVIDALVSLFCRANVSAETLWDGGWLLRQLLPYSETEFKRHHLELLNDSYKKCSSALIAEVRGIWPDQLITVLCDEWKKCKRAIESSSPRKEPKNILLPRNQFILRDDIPVDSSFTAGEKMCEVVKVFVLLHQLQLFTVGRVLPELPPIHPARDESGNSRSPNSGLDVAEVKPGSEISLEKAVSCRIAFERGKERHVFFLAVSKGTSGRLVLAEELPLKQYFGVIRVIAPLAGCNPRVDDKHSRWLHLRIRPSSLPFLDPAKSQASSKMKTKSFVDGRWTLAFRDEESCNSALSMTLGQLNQQSNEVERRLKPLLNLGSEINPFISSFGSTEGSKYATPSNSL